MTDIHTVLDRIHRQLVPSDDAFERLVVHRARRRRRQGLAAATLALVVAASGIGFAVWAFSAADPPGSKVKEQPRPSEASTTPEEPPWAGQPLPPANPRIAWTEPVGPEGQTTAILFAEASLWVSYYEGGGSGSFLARLDPETGETLARIEAVVPGWVTGGGGLTSGYGSIWVTGQNAVHRIDPIDNEVVATIPLEGRGADIAVGADAVWVAFSTNDRSGVARIDPATNQIVATIPIESNYVRWIVASDEAVIVEEFVWQGGGPCGVLTSIDPATNAIQARAEVDSRCKIPDLISWNGQVWASSEDLARVDSASATLAGQLIPFDRDRFPRSFVIAESREVWFAAYPGGNGGGPDTLARLDPATGDIEYFNDLEEIGGIDATLGPNAIWVLHYEGNVTRIDLR